jgi:hypothetical protein
MAYAKIIISIQHGQNIYRVGDEVFPSGNSSWIISEIEKTDVAGQMAMVTAFNIYTTNVVTQDKTIWRQVVPSDYEEEYLLEVSMKV